MGHYDAGLASTLVTRYLTHSVIGSIERSGILLPQVRTVSQNSSGAIGLAIKYPCASSHFLRNRKRNCSSVSTPSATTLIFNPCDIAMMVRTTAAALASVPAFFTKL